MKPIFRNTIIATVMGSMLLGFCGCEKSGTTYDNENDPLTFSTLDVDKVFNPFFYTSGADGNVVGLTQLAMLGNDMEGNPVCGDDEAVIVKDYEITDNGETGDNLKTTYKFVLKNNIKFSNGSALTIKDVLFNFYVYLDPAYTGSSTIYSTDIVGLKEYRTQEENENEQDAVMLKFQTTASERIDNLVICAEEIIDQYTTVTYAEMKDYLQQRTGNEAYKHVVKDFEKADELFKEELENDWSNSLNSYEETSFADETGKVYKPFTTDVEVFLYNENYITWNKKEGKLYSSLANDPSALKKWTKEQAVSTVYEDKFPNSISEIVQYWNTSVTLSTFLTNQAMEEYYKTATRKYKNIEGIKFANKDGSVTVKNITYGKPEYNSNGSVVEKAGNNEVLSITINKVDPKAIWNFAIGVAPMYYYSDAEHIAKFDYEENFGVEYGSQTFLTNVVKSPAKVGVPVGAGPYAASRSSGGIDNVTSDEFYQNSMIYFERNPYFVMGPAKIKKLRYQVVPSPRILDTLYNHQIDFAAPNAKPETVSELNKKKKEGLGNKTINTAGYGYIGVNAGKVPNIKVRQAIMHSIDVQECVNYYGTLASPLYRSMSKENWAYPDHATPYYPYIGGRVPTDLEVVNPDYKAFVASKGKKAGDTFTAAEQQEFIRSLVEDAGYTPDSYGVYTKGSDVLKYPFVIAGAETDHPAWNALVHASEILNASGFQINVTTDSNALKKLASGELTVWAAAWSSTIDPDMYQVYHKDSKATSVLNWGYKQILLNAGGKYDEEYAIVNDLSEVIDAARKTNNQPEREMLYSQALDMVMQLAVELPTYQRVDLFAYNSNKINESTFNQDVSSYKGLTSDIHLVSLIEEK